jgi:hypothetical protein
MAGIGDSFPTTKLDGTLADERQPDDRIEERRAAHVAHFCPESRHLDDDVRDLALNL